jgi:hypothetical protein
MPEAMQVPLQAKCCSARALSDTATVAEQSSHVSPDNILQHALLVLTLYSMVGCRPGTTQLWEVQCIELGSYMRVVTQCTQDNNHARHWRPLGRVLDRQHKEGVLGGKQKEV